MVNFFSLLADKVELINTGDVNFIGDYISFLIRSVGSVGIAVILFTLTLKLITLPLDVYSRIKMKKNSFIMRKIKGKMEEIQKYYGDDKQVYNQKMTELYRKEGYSMFGPCLPMIISLVFFFIALNAFSSYSRYSVASHYNQAVTAYNEVIASYEEEAVSSYEKDYKVVYEQTMELYNADYIDALADAEAEKVYNSIKENYASDSQGLTSSEIEEIALNAKSAEYQSIINLYSDEYIRNLAVRAAADKFMLDKEDEMIDKAQTAARDVYYEKMESFLWIKNVWISDNPFKKAVPTLSEFESLTGYKIDSGEYNSIIAKMDKEQVNGYFILTVLCIGVTVVSQIVMNRAQKEQMNAQPNGMSMKSMNKVMMIMLPLMMGIFSYSYSGAFSTYMVISSVFSTATTLIINFIIDKKLKLKFLKEEEENKKRPVNR